MGALRVTPDRHRRAPPARRLLAHAAGAHVQTHGFCSLVAVLSCPPVQRKEESPQAQ